MTIRKLNVTLIACASILLLVSFASLKSLQSGNLKVFGSFWESGWAVAHHLNPYAAYPLTWRFHPFLKQSFQMVDLNLSPPALLPVFHLMSFFHPNNAVRVWMLLSLIVLFGCVALMMARPNVNLQKRQIIWLLLCPAMIDTISLGQDYIFLMALVVIALLLIERGDTWTAGIFIGILVAAKPNYTLWPLFLLLCGQKRLAKAAILTALLLCILPIALYGPDVYVEWVRAASIYPHWIFPTNISLSGFASRFNCRVLGQALSLVLILFSCAFVAWKRPSVEAASGLALCVGTIAAPLAWFHYSLLLAPLLLRTAWDKKLTWTIAPLMLPIVFSFLAASESPLAGAFASLFYLLPFCFLTVHFCQNRRIKEEWSRTRGKI